MGKSVGKIILPLVAVGIGAAVTGPWGLGWWGATQAAGAGAAAGAAAAPVAAAEGLTTGAVSTLSSAGFPMSVPAAGAAGVQSAGELALVSHAAAASAPAASTGLWGTLKSNADIIGLGFSAAKSVMGFSQAKDQSQLDMALLAHQQMQDELARETKGLENDIALGKTIAAQNNFYAAHGVDTGAGSALHQANVAEAEAEKRMLAMNSQANSAASIYAIRRAGAKRSASGLALGALGDFGSDAFSVWSGRQKIGRA